MRSRERLIEILPTVNGHVIGSQWMADELKRAASALRGDRMREDGRLLVAANLPFIAKESTSAHVRELAVQAQHYLSETVKQQVAE